jgi:hypothetical protein
MTRRNLLSAAAAAGVAAPSTQAAQAKNAILEMRWLRMRNGADEQARRTKAFLEQAVAPALKRNGVALAGFFESLVAPDGPFVLMVSSYPDLATYYNVTRKLFSAEANDPELEKARAEYYAAPGLGYQRMEVSLLRAFDSIPQMETGAAPAARPRVFELRIYESGNFHTLHRKIKMFDDAELAIFRKAGIQPVWFGETLVGRNMPNLTYMVAYENLAGREAAWSRFLADPDWIELRGRKGLSDAEIVSNVSNSLLRPLPFSAIR